MNLKPPRLRSDRAGMFSATSNADLAGQGTLRKLRLSLNTPVVAIEELPVGPASAGIALHEGPRGRSLCLAVRTVRTGQLVLFAADDGWDAPDGPSLGLEAALSFAESMGFLFDDDLVAGSDSREGVRRWAELLVEPVPPEPDEPEAGATPVLSKFRLRPMPMSVVEAPPAGHGELWLKFLSRF